MDSNKRIYVVVRAEGEYDPEKYLVMGHYNEESAIVHVYRANVRAQEIATYMKEVLEKNDWLFPDELELPKNEYDEGYDANSLCTYIRYYVNKVALVDEDAECQAAFASAKANLKENNEKA